MIRKVIALFLFVLLLVGCRHQNVSKPQETATDTTAMMVYQIQHCAKLYTQEYKLRKIVVYDDTATLTGHLLGKKIKMDLPLGKRRIAIPMTATAQASIDFSHFSPSQVRRNGRRLEIILPDPQVTLTATAIDHGQVKEKVALLRTRFSDEERSRIEQQGRTAIVRSLEKMNLTESARQSAIQQLMPMLRQMGWDDEDVVITFRDDLGNSPFETLIRKSN